MFPCSGEINRKVPDGRAAINAIQELYVGCRQNAGLHRRVVDGVRAVAAQPALVEHRAADPAERRKAAVAKTCMRDKTAEILDCLRDARGRSPGACPGAG
jgi:hypothetical protein